MRIALDVDGVLADVIVSWIKYNRLGIKKHEIIKWEAWELFKPEMDRYAFYKELDLCWEEWMSVPTTEENLSSMTESLSNLGTVDIVTARNPQTNSSVKLWLDYHNISYDKYVSVISGPAKADLDYDVFIDDSPINVARFLKNNKRIILYSQPWNQDINDERIHRVSNLSEAIKKIKTI